MSDDNKTREDMTKKLNESAEKYGEKRYKNQSGHKTDWAKIFIGGFICMMIVIIVSLSISSKNTHSDTTSNTDTSISTSEDTDTTTDEDTSTDTSTDDTQLDNTQTSDSTQSTADTSADTSGEIESGKEVILKQDTPVCSSKKNVDTMINYVSNHNNNGINTMIQSGEAEVLPAGSKVNVVDAGILTTEIQDEYGQHWFTPRDTLQKYIN